MQKLKYILLFILLTGLFVLCSLHTAANTSQSPKVTPQPQISSLGAGVELSDIDTKTPALPEVPDILKRIGFCESGNNQFRPDGSLKVSYTNDVGKYQINLSAHADQAKKMGYDLNTEYGNTLFALWLYNIQGTSPWNASKHCWGNSQP